MMPVQAPIVASWIAAGPLATLNRLSTKTIIAVMSAATPRTTPTPNAQNITTERAPSMAEISDAVSRGLGVVSLYSPRSDHRLVARCARRSSIHNGHLQENCSELTGCVVQTGLLLTCDFVAHVVDRGPVLSLQPRRTPRVRRKSAGLGACCPQRVNAPADPCQMGSCAAGVDTPYVTWHSKLYRDGRDMVGRLHHEPASFVPGGIVRRCDRGAGPSCPRENRCRCVSDATDTVLRRPRPD